MTTPTKSPTQETLPNLKQLSLHKPVNDPPSDEISSGSRETNTSESTDEKNYSTPKSSIDAASPLPNWAEGGDIDPIRQLVPDNYDSGIQGGNVFSSGSKSDLCTTYKSKYDDSFTNTFEKPSSRSKKNKKNRNKKNNKQAVRNNSTDESRCASDNEGIHFGIQEEREYEVHLAVRKKDMYELLGKKGCHVKTYDQSKKFDTKITVIPGKDWCYATKKTLREDETGIITDNVIHFESFTQENLLNTLNHIDGRFKKFSHVELHLEDDVYIDPSFYDRYEHHGTYYESSSYTIPQKKYNQTHTKPAPETDSKWKTNEELKRLSKENESFKLKHATSGIDEYTKAMNATQEQLTEQWRNDKQTDKTWPGPNKSKKNKKNKNKNKCYTCQALALNKNYKNLSVSVSSIKSRYSICVQQPTHDSFPALDQLEYNMWNYYDRMGYGERRDMGDIKTIQKNCPVGSYCVVKTNEERYSRGRVERLIPDQDLVEVYYTDYGGLATFNRADVYEIAHKFLNLAFFATPVELVSLRSAEADQPTTPCDDETTRNRTSTMLVSNSSPEPPACPTEISSNIYAVDVNSIISVSSMVDLQYWSSANMLCAEVVKECTNPALSVDGQARQYIRLYVLGRNDEQFYIEFADAFFQQMVASHEGIPEEIIVDSAEASTNTSPESGFVQDQYITDQFYEGVYPNDQSFIIESPLVEGADPKLELSVDAVEFIPGGVKPSLVFREEAYYVDLGECEDDDE